MRVTFVEGLLTAAAQDNRKLSPCPPSKGPNLNLQHRNRVKETDVMLAE